MITATELTQLTAMLCDIPAAAEEIRCGRVLLVADDPDLEGTCHLIAAADRLSAQMAHHIQEIAGGLLCLAVTASDLRSVQVPAALQDEFTMGIAFGAPPPSDALSLTGQTRHSLVPVTARRHGVLRRQGPAECAIDLMQLAGVEPRALVCDVARDHSTSQLLSWSTQLESQTGIKGVCLVDVIRHRLSTENHVCEKGRSDVSTRYGRFEMTLFESDICGQSVALTKGTPESFAERAPLVRIESSTSLGRIHSSLLTCMGATYHQALDAMYHDGAGIVVFLPSNSKGSLGEYADKARLPFLRDDPFGVLSASIAQQVTSAGICAQILRSVDANKIRIVSDKARRVNRLRNFGIEIADEVFMPSLN